MSEQWSIGDACEARFYDPRGPTWVRGSITGVHGSVEWLVACPGRPETWRLGYDLRPLAADEWRVGDIVEVVLSPRCAPRRAVVEEFEEPGDYDRDPVRCRYLDNSASCWIERVPSTVCRRPKEAASPSPAASSSHWNGTCPQCGSRTWSGLGGMPAEHDGACRPKEPRVLLVGVDMAVGEKPVEPFYMLGGYPGRFATPAAALAWWERNR